ncbi:SUMF1/EgtB/PvdO family nonheme iron enzyme [Endozoicomonas sp. SM1973]|uniref:SUMF1/EgtB/PvdO family nonheme iron enzyme n=1 Tax=Spartinivicinus marinus TaxID=2994442 RepID=A0A853IHH4_9GAMM|nr:SUMF1/EgtB/PvdO family nonheme iron enzyme [Spartinivicinus marinus]MCX4028230.1 SUMF1/EgtB/PvdO family nonheme iron enzyme [Spartinivicinus marinus]NYZ69484.1 SUMF1/EgtB/PvdO family nonheme iron enzyme [Spartinivicinus marinus]
MGIYSILFFLVWIILSTLNSTVLAKEYTPEELEQAVKDLAERAEVNMVFIKGGEFWMGDQDPNDPNISSSELSRVKHRVKLDDFYLGEFEVTFEEFYIFIKVNSIKDVDEETTNYVIEKFSPKVPAFYVSWNNANDYCNWLADLTSKPFRLPTEAEWEYAARNRGKDINYSTNDGTLKVDINTDLYTLETYKELPEPVGHYPPNPLGLYGMEGGVSEWVNDWFDKNYFENSPLHNPEGPKNGKNKVYRGNKIGNNPKLIYLYNRRSAPVDTGELVFVGFRCAMSSL